MTGFDVTVPAVSHTATAAATISSELRTELDAVRAHAEAVLAGEWLGRAAATFEHAWRDWHTEAADVIAALTALADSLQATATSYCTGDEAGRTTLLMATA